MFQQLPVHHSGEGVGAGSQHLSQIVLTEKFRVGPQFVKWFGRPAASAVDLVIGQYFPKVLRVVSAVGAGPAEIPLPEGSRR